MYVNKYHGEEDLSKIKILVTGGAGFIGSNIVEYLVKYGVGKVRILDNLSTGYLENIKMFLELPNVEFVKGDIRNIGDCQKACENIDFVLHQAALGSVPRSIEDPITSNEVNVSGFLNILIAVRDQGVKRIVYAASSSTYGDSKELPKIEERIGKPLSPYAVTKYVNELYADVFTKTYGIETIGLRYFNVFGPKQNPKGAYAAVIPLFIQTALMKKKATIFGDGETSRDFTFVENAVQANIKAIFSKNKNLVVNIACNQTLTLNNLWREITDIIGVGNDVTYLDERKGDVKHSLASIELAEKMLDYHPQVLTKEGLIISCKWYDHYFAQKIQ